MNFQRGLDPKQTMSIGIMEKARVVLRKLLEENIPLNKKGVFEKIEKQFKEEVGLDMKIKVTMDRESLDFHIQKTPNEIVIISPWHGRSLDQF